MLTVMAFILAGFTLAYNYHNEAVSEEDLSQVDLYRAPIQEYWEICKNIKYQLAEIKNAEKAVTVIGSKKEVKLKVKEERTVVSDHRDYLKKFGWQIFDTRLRYLKKQIIDGKINPVIGDRLIHVGLDYYRGQDIPADKLRSVKEVLAQIESKYPIKAEYQGYDEDLVNDYGTEKHKRDTLSFLE